MDHPQHKLIIAGGRFEDPLIGRALLRRHFEAFQSSPKKGSLVIHFHGGLVPRSDGEAIADRLLAVYQTAGTYPLFLVWQTGLIETLSRNWQDTLGLKAFTLLKERVVQLVLGKLGQRPGEKGSQVELPPISDVRREIRTKEAEGKIPFEDYDLGAPDIGEQLSEAEERQLKAQIENDIRYPAARAELIESKAGSLGLELEGDLSEARTKNDTGDKALITGTALLLAASRIAWRVVARLASGRGHGIYTTVVEEVARELKGDMVGGSIWRAMKRDMENAFNGPSDVHGGTALIDELTRLWEAGERPRLILVGHSAGAIYICQLLRAAQRMQIPRELQFEVVFLAPACTFTLFDQTLAEAAERIICFRSFAMKDELERADAAFPPVYLRSLLYFVSGLAEDEADMPLVGMQRYHSGRKPFDSEGSPEIIRALHKLAHHENSFIWSRCENGHGLNSSAFCHGDFDNDEPTLASVVYLLSRGFA